MLAILPLSHIFGLSFILLLSVATGATMVLHIRFEPERVLADITRKRITVLSAVSTMYTTLVNHPRATSTDFSSLQRCTSGGGGLSPTVLRRFQQFSGLTPLEGYGLTETAPLATMQPANRTPRAGTVGLPAPHTTIEIVDLETGTKVLPAGSRGEICIRGPQVMKGYWRDEERTRSALRGGRFHTGDFGFLDSDGYLTILDRVEDLIDINGKIVSPRKIENAICSHPNVAEAAVVGASQGSGQARMTAYVVMQENMVPITHHNLCAFLDDKVEPHERPSALAILPALPKTQVAKIDRKALVGKDSMTAREAL